MNEDSVIAGVSDGPNRRDLLKGAAGIAAAATVGGLLIGPPFAAAAPTNAAPYLWCSISGLVGGPNSPFRLQSMVWSGGVQRATTGAGSQSGRPVLASVRMTKAADANSNALVRAMLTGALLASATITYANTGGVVQQAFELTGVFLSSFGTSSGGDPFYEEFELEYTTISFVMPGLTTVTYNQATNTVS